MSGFVYSKKYNKIKEILFICLGILISLFYAVCLSFSHVGVSWLWIWPAAAVFCFVRAFMLSKQIFAPKWLGILYRIVLVVFLLLFIIIESRIVSAMNDQPDNNLDYIITLGAAVRDGEPTSPLKLRINRTIEYLQDNPDTVLIASGGQGPEESVSEARCIADYVINAGIDADRILLEEESSDTEENIRNSFSMIPSGSSVGIVTSSFHIYRALRAAEIQGLEACGVPGVTYYPLGWHYLVREFFGVVQLEAENILRR